MSQKHEQTITNGVRAGRNALLQMHIRQRLLSAANEVTRYAAEAIDLQAILAEAAECAEKLGFRREEMEDVLSGPLQGALASIQSNDAETVERIVAGFTSFLSPARGSSAENPNG